jgi:glutaredoxin
MNRLATRLLSAFDSQERAALDLDSLTATAKGHVAGNEQVRAELNHLVTQGLLREESGKFARTEDGRLAVAGPRDLTLYSRPGCHLCEEVKTQIAPLVTKFSARLREVNIDTDPVLRERYNDEVPVLFLGSRKAAKYKVNLEQLKKQLERVEKDS